MLLTAYTSMSIQMMRDFQLFLHALQNQLPAMAVMADIQTKSTLTHFTDFSIIPDSPKQSFDLWITPDLALCEACRLAIQDVQNRRYQYAFTTCLNCGPRYSIMKALPTNEKIHQWQIFQICPWLVIRNIIAATMCVLQPDQLLSWLCRNDVICNCQWCHCRRKTKSIPLWQVHWWPGALWRWKALAATCSYATLRAGRCSVCFEISQNASAQTPGYLYPHLRKPHNKMWN